MLEMLSYGFMQRAMIAGIMVGIICPLIGIYLVLRRMSMIGDSLSHVALSGVAAGMLTGTYPVVTALGFSVVAALAIERLRRSFAEYAELAIAIVLSTGIGLAVVLISLAKSFNASLYSYLFGNITTVMPQDLWLILALGIVIVSGVFLLYKELFYIAFDEVSATLSGVPVKAINLVFIVMIAANITLSMRIVGILLVSSLMVLPVAASLQLAKSFKQAMLYAVLLAQGAVLSGMVIAYQFELASGGTIVLMAVFELLVILLFKRLKKDALRKVMM
ncbi:MULTISPECIES: metal ABC transporter permease [unclassified Fusibacter]|uniref:metal ABC transporter permease n=1 Tax=unclassified Fusibacter TaxID=2624464 RepID=UPI001012944C|nr:MULTISPECIES: metal ABC transporter permease [unclassified Fusibacter]MCK8060652.1 metal ABC transporter permease [Fusibacter sp. A2]NPE22894.1 metal ABC transporter permease [Fusibacter sp. A1]RXV59962.1 metal ABC transporter permease [Fusibacter sp. A1]